MVHLILVACDRCVRDGQQIAATEEIVVAFGSKKARRLDLCAEHAKPYQELQEFAETDGAPLRDDAHSREKPCPQCGQLFQSRGLPMHIRMAHPKHDRTYPCPECGQEFESPQGRGSHRRVHEVEGRTI